MKARPTQQLNTVQRYALGVATIALASVLESGLHQLAGDNARFMLLHPALVLIAVYCGRGPALLALLLSTVQAAVSLYGFTPTDTAARGQYAILIYIVVGTFVVFVTSALRHWAERANAAERRLRMIQDDFGVGLVEVDLRRKQFLASQSLWRLLGRTGPDTPTAYEGWQSNLPADETERFGAALHSRLAAGDTFFEHEFSRSQPNEPPRHFMACVNIEYEQGAVRFLRAAVMDVTGRKKLEAEQQVHLEELRDVDRRRTEFLALLAHELRNPLAPIRHAALLSQMPNADANQVRWSLGVIDRQVTHMARLLEDLLDASRISRGALELRLETVELNSVLALAIETARPVLDAKEHAFDCQLSAEPVWLRGDPVRLAQVFSNLLTNAAKYTPAKGLIRLTTDTTQHEVAVAVHDNGIGIAPEMLPRIFEMFAQADSARDYAQGGVGIGLALVKGLVQLHGGNVIVRSSGLQRGSEFAVRLPRIAAPAARPISATPEVASIAPRRILIADDNRDAADSLAMLLQLEGHDVYVAYDGDSALQLCSERPPQVALLDIGMPRIDGYELARRMRAQSWGLEAQLVAISGEGQLADRARALEAGFDAHLTKPVSLHALAMTLAGKSPDIAAA